jgi:putative aldouronate transport system permease protein
VKTLAKFGRLSAFDIINTLIMFIFGLFAFYPLYNIYIYAFNDGLDSMRGVLYLWPRKFSLDNFRIAFTHGGIFNAFMISIARTVIGTILTLICTSSLAFVMTKRKLPGYQVFSMFFFITFIFNGGLIPYFLTIRTLNLYNTFWIMVVPGMYNYWYMVLFRSFFDSIPDSIEESAKIDGASYFNIYSSLILPLSKPVLAAIALLQAVNHWNDWFTGIFYIKDLWLTPLQTLLQKLMTEVNMIGKLVEMSGGNLMDVQYLNVTPYTIRLSIAVITITPIVLIYPFLQQYFVKGIMVGSIKG